MSEHTITLRRAVNDSPGTGQPMQLPSGVFAETVVRIQHYSDRLFSFRITRPASFRFRSGEFVMIGLPRAEKPVLRAYSIASPNWDDELEFFSIKVPGGSLTEHLQKIQPGDIVIMKQKPTGTLVLDALMPGKRLFMISTGTGLAPFASIIRDPESYEKFEKVILTHTCRNGAELTYGFDVVEQARLDPLVGEIASQNLTHFASTTQEDSAHRGRITALIDDGSFFAAIGMPAFDPSQDRIMLCGSAAMLQDLRAIFEARGFTEGSNNRPATYVVEKAFVG